MEKIILDIKAKHLIGSKFIDNSNCGIANAIKDQLNITNDDEISVGTNSSYIKHTEFRHEFYGRDLYDVDMKIAKYFRPNDVIRTITLTPAQNDGPTI